MFEKGVSCRPLLLLLLLELVTGRSQLLYFYTFAALYLSRFPYYNGGLDGVAQAPTTDDNDYTQSATYSGGEGEKEWEIL